MSGHKIEVRIEGRQQVIERLFRALAANLEPQVANLPTAQLALLRALQAAQWSPDCGVVTIEHEQAADVGARLAELARSNGLAAEASIGAPMMQFMLNVHGVAGGDGGEDNPTFATINIPVDLAQRIVEMSSAVKENGWYEVSSFKCGTPVFWESEGEPDWDGAVLPEDREVYGSDASVMLVAENYVKWRASSRHGSAYFQTEHVDLDGLRKFVAAHSRPSDDYTVSFEVSVTAASPTKGAVYALQDLRDLEIGPWNARVRNCGSGEVLLVSTDGAKGKKSPGPAM